MASMTTRNGRRPVPFAALDGRRFTFSPDRLARRDAQAFAAFLDRLRAARKANLPLDQTGYLAGRFFSRLGGTAGRNRADRVPPTESPGRKGGTVPGKNRGNYGPTFTAASPQVGNSQHK
jgi:hypothetical protein